MSSKLLQMIPGIEANELAYLQTITKELNDDQLQTFAALYNGERKKSDMILIGGIIGLLGIGGIQRFMIGQVGMGIPSSAAVLFCFPQ